MIAGTNTDCKILKTEIVDSTATLTLLFFGNKATYPAKSFQIYLQDSNEKRGYMELASSNIYWIDYRNSFTVGDNNIDINKYKEVKITVDISNGNTSKIVDNHWIRECYIHIVKTDDVLKKPCWSSGLLQLISSELEPPYIKTFNCHTGTIQNNYYPVCIDCSFDYKSDIDYNYNNKNYKYEILIENVGTGKVLETITQEEEYLPQSISVTSNASYQLGEAIAIELKIRALNDVLVESYKQNYVLEKKLSNTYIKTNNGIKKVIAFYVARGITDDERKDEWLEDKNNVT